MIQMNIFNVTVFLSRYFGAVRSPPQDSKRNEEERWEFSFNVVLTC